MCNPQSTLTLCAYVKGALSGTFRICQYGGFWQFWEVLQVLLRCVGVRDPPPPHFEGGEVKNTCFGRYLDG